MGKRKGKGRKRNGGRARVGKDGSKSGKKERESRSFTKGGTWGRDEGWRVLREGWGELSERG